MSNNPRQLLCYVSKKYGIDIYHEANEFTKHETTTLTAMVIMCCERIGADYEKVISASRKREIVMQRQCIQTAIYEQQLFSLKAIGGEFGGRDHSTVTHSKQTVSDLIETKNKVVITYMNNLRNYLATTWKPQHQPQSASM